MRIFFTRYSRYGITDSVFSWLENFLTSRVQSVNCLSPALTVSSGVPQGTVLGPLLFLCYSADITDVIKTVYLVYLLITLHFIKV